MGRLECLSYVRIEAFDKDDAIVWGVKYHQRIRKVWKYMTTLWLYLKRCDAYIIYSGIVSRKRTKKYQIFHPRDIDRHERHNFLVTYIQYIMHRYAFYSDVDTPVTKHNWFKLTTSLSLLKRLWAHSKCFDKFCGNELREWIWC